MKGVLRFFSRYLNVLVLTPCIFLVAFVSVNVSDAINKIQESQAVEWYVKLGDSVLALVHEVQKERGMTAGFLGSQGNQFGAELISQQSRVDDAIERMKGLLSITQLDKNTRSDIDEIQDKLRALASMRSQVKALSVPLSDALAYYTSINTLGLKSLTDISSVNAVTWINSSFLSGG